jgi:hypothetical protein
MAIGKADVETEKDIQPTATEQSLIFEFQSLCVC